MYQIQSALLAPILTHRGNAPTSNQSRKLLNAFKTLDNKLLQRFQHPFLPIRRKKRPEQLPNLQNLPKFIEEDEQKPDFGDMMPEVQEGIEEHDAEDAIVSRAPELRQLSENIDKATNTWVNVTLQLESAIRKYNLAQTTLGNAVDTISGKVDTINKHIDNVLKEAPTKLQVSVKVSDADRKTIQDMFDKEHKWMTGQMKKHIREVN